MDRWETQSLSQIDGGYFRRPVVRFHGVAWLALGKRKLLGSSNQAIEQTTPLCTLWPGLNWYTPDEMGDIRFLLFNGISFAVFTELFTCSYIQFKVLRDGSWKKINFERPDLQVEKADGSRDLLKSPWIQHFRPASRVLRSGSPNYQTSSGKGKKALAYASAGNSEQFHACHSYFGNQIDNGNAGALVISDVCVKWFFLLLAFAIHEHNEWLWFSLFLWVPFTMF